MREKRKEKKTERNELDLAILLHTTFSIGFKMVISKTCSIQVFQKLFISVDRCLNNLAWLRFQSIFIYAERFNFCRVRSEESPNWHSECKFHIQKSLILQFHMPRIKKQLKRKKYFEGIGLFYSSTLESMVCLVLCSKPKSSVKFVFINSFFSTVHASNMWYFSNTYFSIYKTNRYFDNRS